MIKITLAEIFRKDPAIKEMLGLSLPIKVSYWLSRAVKIIDAELKTYYEESGKISNRILEQFHAKKKEDGTFEYAGEGQDLKPVFETPEDEAKAMVEFNKEIAALGAIEIEFPFEPININDCGNINIKPAILASLSEFFALLE